MFAVAAVAAVAEPGPAKPARPWATVNVCDTEAKRDVLGLRASMPGIGRRRAAMFMRFRAEYRDGDGIWRLFSDAARTDSGFTRVAARADLVARQSGWSFRFRPGKSDRYVLRGRVDFQWRGPSGRVLKRAQRLTSAGRVPAKGDPRGYSAATCTVRG